MVRKLQHRIHDMLHNGISIQLMWTPGQVGISENEEVDKLAKKTQNKNLRHIYRLVPQH